MFSVDSRHLLKVKHARRRLSDRVIDLYGRRSSRAVENFWYKRHKPRFFSDIDQLNKLIVHRTVENGIVERFYLLEKRLSDRIEREEFIRDSMDIKEGYYEIRIRNRNKRPYIRRAQANYRQYASD